MVWTLTAYSAVAFVAVAIAGVLMVTTWRHRAEPHAAAFGGLVAAIAAWAFVYGVQLGFTTLAGQLVWQRATLAVASAVPPLWLLFALQYAGSDRWLTRPILALFVVEPLTVSLAAVTNPLHHLLWTDAVFRSSVPVAALAFGPGYYAHVSVAYLMVAAGLALLVSVAVRTATVYRRQVGVLIAGALPPFAAHIAFSLGVSPVRGLDLTPFAFTLTGVCFGLALFHFDLLDRTPVARERALAAMGDGLVVVDDQGVVVDADDVARSVLDPAPRAGESLGTDVRSLDGTSRTATVDGAERTFDLHVSPLRDHSGRQTGAVVVLRDVTDRHAYEQRLEVANRVLRHNLRNEMTVIIGCADLLDVAVDGEHADRVGTIQETAWDLVDTSEKVRRMVEVSRTGTEASVAVDVTALVTDVVETFRAEYPDAVVRVDGPEAVRATVADEQAVRTAVANLVENAVEHNDAETPRVTVTVTSEGEQVRVLVADNGPGIPPRELAVIERGTETPLDHSDGVGLWLAYWGTAAAGGEFTFHTERDEGAAVELSFPVAGAEANSTLFPVE